MNRLFQEENSAFNELLINFISEKYDLMVTQLQFDHDLRAKNFQGPEDIVNFLCEKLAQDPDDVHIMVPKQVRRELEADLTVISDQEFRDLKETNNYGLIKIFQGVRGDLSKVHTKRQFMKTHREAIFAFYDEDIIDRISDQIWALLQSMRCPHLCPWCGMPCCGITECNDKYVQGKVLCKEEARNKHSCQFHRDITITGVSKGESSQLLNSGDCTKLISRGRTRKRWDPEHKEFLEVPDTYYDTTWEIRPRDDMEPGGLFWQWFHAHVSFNLSPETENNQEFSLKKKF